ncbi:MAG: cysteine--tRNA ligase [Candidatus Omnitrophica bacterium]|nr:cysteine--tRNA ligase [Candidatus Omnitrophota bacterium]
MHIHNTLTRKKEEFRPLKKGTVTMYVCGPTVYDEPHIGHARSAYVFDAMQRYFKYKKYKVIFVRNVTDVDDKIINKAREEFKGEDLNSAVKKVSDKYLKSYHRYMDELGIQRPDKEPKATEYIKKMKDFVSLLIRKGAAYESGGDVYFDIKKARDYGKLSNQSFEMLESGARPVRKSKISYGPGVSPGKNKKDPLDFALWKKAKEGESSWDSPWGKGRPGWHIECSVMSSDVLGDEFDIHGGGIDLIFPHHENEIAQSEGAGKKFARFWIHNGLLTINKEKMAKSLGNFVTVDEILNKYSRDVLKLVFLGTHYSHPVDFSWERMETSKEALGRIIRFLEEVKKREKGYDQINGANFKKSPLAAFKEQLDDIYSDFERYMDNDFDIPNAFASLFDIVRAGNTVLHWSKYDNKKHLKYLKKAREAILELGDVLGLEFKQKQGPLSIPEKDIKDLIEKRNQARKSKDFKAADEIRKELEEAGIVLEDTKAGTTWRKG